MIKCSFCGEVYVNDPQDGRCVLCRHKTVLDTEVTRGQIIAKWNGMSSRERDAWVAEVVFGVDTGDKWFSYTAVKGNIHDSHELHRVTVLSDVPHYTTDISAAWAVFELNGYYGGVSYMGTDYRCELWARWDADGRGVHVKAAADTAPEAICLAGLIAKLTEVAE